MSDAKFKMEFDLGNDYFVSGGDDAIALVLDKVAEDVQWGTMDHGDIFDGNGNKVGEWSYSRDHEEPDEDDPVWNDAELDPETEEQINYKWSDTHREWYEASEVCWDREKGDYLPI